MPFWLASGRCGRPHHCLPDLRNAKRARSLPGVQSGQPNLTAAARPRHGDDRADRAAPRAGGRERLAAGGVACPPSHLARAAERPHLRAGGRARLGQPGHRVRAAQVRVAAVDLGTNSTRLLVADANGTLEEVVRRLRITRLGEGVDERRKLLPLPIARVRNVLSEYRRELEALGAERTLCIATSAVRDAENGEAFLGEIEWSYGFKTRLLSGEEEAADDAARDRRRRARHARRRHRRRLDGAPARRGGPAREPRHRLRPPDRAVRRGRRRGARARARPAPRRRVPSAQSASPAR